MELREMFQGSPEELAAAAKKVTGLIRKSARDEEADAGCEIIESIAIVVIARGLVALEAIAASLSEMAERDKARYDTNVEK